MSTGSTTACSAVLGAESCLSRADGCGGLKKRHRQSVAAWHRLIHGYTCVLSGGRLDRPPTDLPPAPAKSKAHPTIGGQHQDQGLERFARTPSFLPLNKPQHSTRQASLHHLRNLGFLFFLSHPFASHLSSHQSSSPPSSSGLSWPCVCLVLSAAFPRHPSSQILASYFLPASNILCPCLLFPPLRPFVGSYRACPALTDYLIHKAQVPCRSNKRKSYPSGSPPACLSSLLFQLLTAIGPFDQQPKTHFSRTSIITEKVLFYTIQWSHSSVQPLNRPARPS